MISKHGLDKLTNLLEDIKRDGIKIDRNDDLAKVLSDVKGLRTAIYLQTCSGLGYLIDGKFYKSEEDLIEFMNNESDDNSSIEELTTKFDNVQTFISTDYLLEWLDRKSVV